MNDATNITASYPARLLITALLGVALATITGCEEFPDFDVNLDKGSPASFSFSGRSPASDFQILEVPRTKPLSKTNPFSYTGRTIWQISSPTKLKGETWPHVEYGVVPNGLLQSIPQNGSPPKLVKAKLYVASFTDGTRRSELFFEIRNGRAMNVTDEVFGP